VVATNSLILNRIFTVRRKAAKRSESWYLEPPENIAAPLSIPARKKSRLEEPLPPTTDESAGKTASLEMSVILYSPADQSRRTPEEDVKLTSAVANTCRRTTERNAGKIGLQLPSWFRVERTFSVVTDGVPWTPASTGRMDVRVNGQKMKTST
jgi:hypothetical protein